MSLAGRDLRLSATLFTTLPGMHDVALPSIVVPVADPVTPDRPTIRAPRATDQPTIVVDPVTGVSYANYPDQPHDVSGIQGSLLIEGGALDKPDYDGALRAGVGLPGETDAPLGARNTGQAPTAAANNRIRLFDDGTLTGQVGMQDMAAQLSGLGRLYNNPQAGDFGRITGLGMTPGVARRRAASSRPAKLASMAMTAASSSTACSRSTPCWARATIPTPCAMRPWAP